MKRCLALALAIGLVSVGAADAHRFVPLLENVERCDYYECPTMDVVMPGTSVYLFMPEARKVVAQQLKDIQWDEMLDGQTHIGRCRRFDDTTVVCAMRTTLRTRRRCTFTMRVIEDERAYYMAVRRLRCA